MSELWEIFFRKEGRMINNNNFNKCNNNDQIQIQIQKQKERYYQLTEEQKQQWEEDGFLILSDLLTDEEKLLFAQWAAEILSWPEYQGKWMIYYEYSKDEYRKKMISRIENFSPYHDGLNAIIRGPTIVQTLSQLSSTCEPFVLFKEKINYKLPHGGGFPPHQDAPAYNQFGQDVHITVMIAVQDATLENGCLEVVRGGHKLGLLPQNQSDGTLLESYVQSSIWEPLLVKAGDVLIFGSFLPHRSGVNKTDSPRTAFYLTYNRLSQGDLRERYYQDKREKFPPEIERLPNVDYSEGARIYNLATPIET